MFGTEVASEVVRKEKDRGECGRTNASFLSTSCLPSSQPTRQASLSLSPLCSCPPWLIPGM